MRNLLSSSFSWLKPVFGLILVVGFTSSAFGAQAVPYSIVVKPGSYNGNVGALAQASEGKTDSRSLY